MRMSVPLLKCLLVIIGYSWLNWQHCSSTPWTKTSIQN